jgi:hypothetical protein
MSNGQEDWLLLRCKQARLAALKEVREMIVELDDGEPGTNYILSKIDALIAKEEGK